MDALAAIGIFFRHKRSKMTAVSLYMAPFRGITHKAYRNAHARHMGHVDAYYAPFVSGLGQGKIHPGKMIDLVPFTGNKAPVIPQIISNDPREIIMFGNALYEKGYRHLNWNLGCPFERIANKKRGCGLLPYPNEIDRILNRVFTELKIALSVKTRLGYDHPDQIKPVLEVFNRYPLYKVILHPRTGMQRYGGKADPGKYAECLHLSSHPMIYNGDIYNHSQYKTLQAMFPGQTEWMLGRGALINPFLAMEICNLFLPDDQKRIRLKAFHNDLWEYAMTRIPGEKKQIGWMKAVWHYLSGIFSAGKEAFEAIKRSQTLKSFEQATCKAIQGDFAGEEQIRTHFLSLTR